MTFSYIIRIQRKSSIRLVISASIKSRPFTISTALFTETDSNGTCTLPISPDFEFAGLLKKSLLVMDQTLRITKPPLTWEMIVIIAIDLSIITMTKQKLAAIPLVRLILLRQ